jgi:hypothetical protein
MSRWKYRMLAISGQILLLRITAVRFAVLTSHECFAFQMSWYNDYDDIYS